MEKDESRFEKTVMYIRHHIFCKKNVYIYTFLMWKNIDKLRKLNIGEIFSPILDPNRQVGTGSDGRRIGWSDLEWME